MLGGLLRLARQELVNHVEAELAAEGMADVRPAQWAVCQQLAATPDGLRLTELAAYAGVTKPSMSALVDALETAGYVQRAPHPIDHRAQLVRFTERGWEFAAVAERAVKRVEKAWSARIGREQVEALRRILRAIVDS
jgi:DNA-binding MarR family transcriptional regulator